MYLVYPPLIDFFTDTAAILNYFDLRSIMGCPGGMITIRCTRLVLEIWLSHYISREKGDRYYILTRHNGLCSHYNLILRRLLEKMPRKALVYCKQNLLMPPGHPIILVKSNLFNMAAVSVKGSILHTHCFHFSWVLQSSQEKSKTIVIQNFGR